MGGFVLFFVTACMFMQMVTEGAVLEDDLGSYFNISAEFKTGGGVLGGALCRLCVIAFRNSRYLCDHPGGIDDLFGTNYSEIDF